MKSDGAIWIPLKRIGLIHDHAITWEGSYMFTFNEPLCYIVNGRSHFFEVWVECFCTNDLTYMLLLILCKLNLYHFFIYSDFLL